MIVTIFISIFFTLKISKFLSEREKVIENDTNKITSVEIKAEGGVARKSINEKIDWVIVNEKTKQVVTTRTEGGVANIKLNIYEDTQKNIWVVSAKSELYSGIAKLDNNNIKVGQFKMYLNKIQTAINVELHIQKNATATTSIPIKWEVPEGTNVKINIQGEDEEPLFYAPPNLFTANYKSNETMLRMPSEPGNYIVRLYDTKHINDPLKEIKIKIVRANIEINAPSEGIAGTSINLSWVSPKSSQGQINIKKKDEKIEYYSRYYVRTRGKESVNLILPSQEGEYVFRWYDFYSKKLIIEKDIKIHRADIKIYVKTKAKLGEKIRVRWSAPKNSMAKVYLKNDLNDKVVARFTVNEKKESEIVMPKKPGMYYLVWICDGDKQEMKRKKIEVIGDE